MSLHFDGFMVDRNLQPDCSTPDFLHRLAHRLLDDTGFTIPFVMKEHTTFMQLLRARAPRADRVLPAEHAACLLTYPCAMAFGSVTGLFTAAVRSIEIARGADEDLTVRQWIGAFNGADLAAPIVVRAAIGFDLPITPGGSLALVVIEDPAGLQGGSGCFE